MTARNRISKALGAIAAEPPRPNPTACGHQAELDRLTDELADYDERAEQEKQRADRAEEECRRYAEADSADAAAGSYALRAERVEAQLAAVADLIADHEGDDWAAHPATTALRDILDSEEYAIAQPATAQANLMVTITAPDPSNAVRWAGHIRDLVHAEFDGGMRLHTSIELEPGGAPEPGSHHWLLQGSRDLSIPDGADGQRCSCGGRFPIHHLHADQHQPINPEQPARTTPDNSPTSSDLTGQLPPAVIAQLPDKPYLSTGALCICPCHPDPARRQSGETSQA